MKYVQMEKKNFLIFAGAFITICLRLVFCLIFHQTVFAEEPDSEDDAANFVLLLDCSGSMSESEQALTWDAVKMFVDMLPADNVSLAIVAFGVDYRNDLECFDFSGIDSMKDDQEAPGIHCAKLVQGLTDCSTLEAKETAKNSIDAALAEANELSSDDTDYSPVGYALMAGCSLLTDAETADGTAALVLLSDGQLLGQTDAIDEGEWYYRSVNDALDILDNKDWTLYCLELNYDNDNEKDEYPYGLARWLMREILPQGDAERTITLDSAAAAQEAFAKILAKYYQTEAVYDKVTISEDQEGETTFHVGTLVTEMTIVVAYSESGDDVVHDIAVTDGENELSIYDEETWGDCTVNAEDRYTVIHVPLPDTGDWTITVYGTTEAEIGIYVMLFHEMELELNVTDGEFECSGDTVQEYTVTKGTSLVFETYYSYQGEIYANDEAYQDYSVELRILEPDDDADPSGEAMKAVAMTAGEDIGGYLCEYTFDAEGEYQVYTYAEDEEAFRGGSVESNICIIHVKNSETVQNGTMEDIEMAIGESRSGIDCIPYFTNEDHDELIWSVTYTQIDTVQDQNEESIENTTDIAETEEEPEDDKFHVSIDADGQLSIEAGLYAGSYEVTVNVSESSAEGSGEGVSQIFTVTVSNQELLLADGISDGDTVSVRLYYGADALTSWLQKWFPIADSSSAEISWEDYFIDPDAIPAIVEITGGMENDIVEVTNQEDTSSVQLQALTKGTVTYTVNAWDRSDSSVQYTLYIRVISAGVRALLIRKYRLRLLGLFVASLLAAAVIIALAYEVFGRKIFGMWEFRVKYDCTDMGESKSDRKKNCKLRRTKPGRRSSVRLDEVLKAVGIHVDFPDLKIKNKNVFSRQVWLTGPIRGLNAQDSNNHSEKEWFYDKNQKYLTEVCLYVGDTIVISDGPTRVTVQRKK